LDSISSFDITGNINYQLMESQELLAQKQVDMQFWSFTPTIAGFYSYTRKFKVSGFDFAPNHVAGLSVSVPLLTSGTRILKVAQAKKELDIAQRNKEMVRDQLALQEKQQLFDFQSALENYSTQKENVEIANRVYTSMQNKYKQGMASSLDLTQANSNYLTAENNYLSAVLTLLQANTSLEKLYNTL
jgi:outer membrane protein TolC